MTDLVSLLGAHPRVIIAGGPRTGKTTLAARVGERFYRAVRNTDSLIGSLNWSDASAEVARWFDVPGDWVIEGVSTPRALRKWFVANPGVPLGACVVWLRDPVQPQSSGAAAMHKGVATVWAEILPELRSRATPIVERD